MTEIMLFLFACFGLGVLAFLICAVIAPDWLDWAYFAGFSMLWPLSLHCSVTIPALILLILAIVADAVAYRRAKRSGAKTWKPLLRLWLTSVVGFAGFAVGAIGALLAGI